MSSAAVQGGNFYQRSRTGCVNCRQRHLKCDDNQPDCSRCAKRGVKCVRGFNVRFKHYSSIPSESKTSKYKASQYSFSSDQPWCEPIDSISFVDESKSLQNTYEAGLDSDLDDEASSQPQEGRRGASPNRHNSTSTSTEHEAQSIARSVGVEQYACSPLTRLEAFQHWTPSDDGRLGNPSPGEITNPSPGLARSISATGTNDPLPLYQDDSMWPLRSATEARLIRYFIDYVSRRFDLCDPEKHFALEVPCRAATCPPLMDAMLALSARYLSRTTGFDEFVADRYYQRCLNSLVPMLSDKEALVNQDLFAAIVVLRTLEEIEVPVSGADSGTHLFGSHLFVSASTGQSPASSVVGQAQSLEFTGLRRASFLVAFRQEVYTAFVSQRPVMPAFILHDIDRSVDKPADDSTWTNRILLHVADVLDFCYNDRPSTVDVSTKRYEELVYYGDRWNAKKPQSFHPIFYGPDPDDDTYDEEAKRLSPNIWLLSDAVATGLLNYHLTRILLLAFDPRTPRLGPSRATFLKLQNDRIKQEVRTLIGMANGNEECAPHFVLACTGIALAGDRFEERWEQEELLQFLKRTESVYAWSTSNAQQHLLEAWSWMETDV